MGKSLKIALFIGSLMGSAFAADTSVSFKRFQRLNTPATEPGANNWLGFSFITKPNQKRFDYNFDVQARISLGGKATNYSLAEAYGEYTWGEHRLSVGRKLLNWVPNESYWLLSNLNGLQGFSLLSGKQEGLTGLHYRFKRGKGTVQAFGSFLAIPSLNPNIKEEGGVLTSSSEWRVMPPLTTRINGKTVPISYNLELPPISDLIFKGSLGVHGSYKVWRGDVYGYGIYKPETKVRANAEAFFDQDKDVVVANADPIINHHMMYGLGTNQKFGQVVVSTGFDIIDPNVNAGSESRTFESDFFTISPRFDKESYFHTSAKIDRGFYGLSLNYIHLLSENVRTGDDFLSDTVKWKRAVGFNINYSFSDRFGILFDLKYDIARKDNVLKSELGYLFYDNLSLSLGVEMIKAPLLESYWSAYRANDIIYSKLDYIF